MFGRSRVRFLLGTHFFFVPRSCYVDQFTFHIRVTVHQVFLSYMLVNHYYIHCLSWVFCFLSLVVLLCCQPSDRPLMLKDHRSTPLLDVIINCLLSKDSELQNVGAALASNIARFKVNSRSFYLVYRLQNCTATHMTLPEPFVYANIQLFEHGTKHSESTCTQVSYVTCAVHTARIKKEKTKKNLT